MIVGRRLCAALGNLSPKRHALKVRFAFGLTNIAFSSYRARA
jgi:hypothetical protein